MDFIYLGKVVNTHGIKGEIRIISDVDFKDLVFKNNFKLYIGDNKEMCTINTYRKHKNYDMVTLNGINNINDVLKYKGKYVYIDKYDIDYDGYFNEDLIGLDVYSKDRFIGKITEILKSKASDILVIHSDKQKFMVPKIEEFIEKVDLNSKKIYINEIKGLF